MLCVLDGFGLNDDPTRNAALAASMWNWHRLSGEFPTCRLAAAGEAVGLPPGQMGNSEVGHLNLGAGVRCSRTCRASTRQSRMALLRRTRRSRRRWRRGDGQRRLHLIGLIGPGGVHAIDGHLVAMAELARRSGLPGERVVRMLSLDGRDTPPRSADGFVRELEERLDGPRRAIATVGGRYYAMDRDQRWERTQRAYDAIVHGQGTQAPSASAAVRQAYAAGDERRVHRSRR